MAHLVDQAPEVLHHIFQCVEPTDLASLSQTCRYLKQLIQNDELLWKLHYLSRFDPPPHDGSVSWRARVSSLVNVQKILESDDQNVKACPRLSIHLVLRTNPSQNAAIEEVLSQTVELTAQSAFPSAKNSKFLAEHFDRPSNINAFLCKSSLFGLVTPNRWTSAPTASSRQLSAQLHVLGGMNLESHWPSLDEFTCPHLAARIAHENDDDSSDYDEDDDDSSDADHGEPNNGTGSSSTMSSRPILYVHAYARSRVYDLRRYTQENMWGPFDDDGATTIDWEKVQAIMIVLAFNYRMYTERRGPGPFPSLTPSTSTGPPPFSSTMVPSSSTTSRSTSTPGAFRPWSEPFAGIAANSFVSSPLSGKLKPSPRPDLDALDPYGVTGSWMRIVCFLDYNDLYAFNFESSPVDPSGERQPIATREAFRLIRLQLRVTSVEAPGPDDGQDLPVVHFEGISRSTFMAWDPNANSRIRGTVRQTPGGAIRWTTFSIFHGEERWRSEGVQIGGIRSARGILGNWFDKDYDPHGPAGPTAFWKVSDQIVEEKERIPPQMMQILVTELFAD